MLAGEDEHEITKITSIKGRITAEITLLILFDLFFPYNKL
jgi:hypothetical protein